MPDLGFCSRYAKSVCCGAAIALLSAPEMPFATSEMCPVARARTTTTSSYRKAHPSHAVFDLQIALDESFFVSHPQLAVHNASGSFSELPVPVETIKYEGDDPHVAMILPDEWFASSQKLIASRIVPTWITEAAGVTDGDTLVLLDSTKVPQLLIQGKNAFALRLTHLWGRSERGKHNVYQRTAKDRFARSLHKVTDWCRRNRHRPVPEQHVRLSRMMKGHFAYFGITGNSRRIRWYAYQVERIWFSSLRRRSRGERGGYRTFDSLLQRNSLPSPRIVHRYAAASEPAT